MNLLRSFKLMAVVLGVSFMASASHASLLIEPHIGYNVSGTGESGLDVDYSGPQYGARLGYQSFGFMLGMDYTKGSGEYESKVGGVTTKQDYDTDDIGAFVGYEFPILLRVWGTYYFSSKMELKGGGDYSGDTKELGVGFTALPFLSLNLMYRLVNHDEVKGGGVTRNVDMDYKEIVVGVSLPFNL